MRFFFPSHLMVAKKHLTYIFSAATCYAVSIFFLENRQRPLDALLLVHWAVD